MKLISRLATAETRIQRRQRRTLIVVQDGGDDDDLYRGDGVTYTLAELERMSNAGWNVIRIVYADEDSTITGETRRKITFDPTGENRGG
jgi:hypothetical protein